MQRIVNRSPERPSIHRGAGFSLTVLLGCAVFPVLGGCNQGRVFSPMAGRSTMDNSGPAMAATPPTDDPARSRRMVAQNRDTGVRITSENATPETDIAAVQQRLTPTGSPHTASGSARQVSHRTAAPADSTQSDSAARHAAINTLLSDSPRRQASSAIPNEPSNVGPVSHITSDTGSPTSLEMPPGFDGVDVSGLMSALQGAPPEVQKAAIARLIAMSRQRAQLTQQPRSIDDALLAQFDSLPELPDEVIDRGVSPARIGQSRVPATAQTVAQTVDQTIVQAAPTSQARFTMSSDSPSTITPVETDPIHTAAYESISDTPPNAPQRADIAGVEPVLAKFSDANAKPTSHVSLATMQTPVITAIGETSPPGEEQPISPVVEMSDAQLFDELVKRLQVQTAGESDADRQRRQVTARHLMVLAGHPDRAVDNLEGLTREEQEYLRNQLLGLWTIIDPQGHPVASRRFSSALPAIRKATSHLAAASDSLEVRALEFCTEIEAYGQIKPFPQRRFAAGQEIILYCEIENFVSDPVDGGFETKLQGSYDLLDSVGRRVSSQTLPEDHQVSQARLRDYFIGYQMYLPDEIEPGKYQLRLTMEDMHGKKYGQSTVDFEIKR